MSKGTMKILEKMTRTKLIEAAHAYPEIVGAHGLSKEQLVEAVAAAMKVSGEFVEEESRPAVKKVKKAKVDKATMKKLLKAAKKARQEALASGKREDLSKARSRIHKLKGRLRRVKTVEAG